MSGDDGEKDATAGAVRHVDTWTAITSRRDVREFDGRPIADADLDQILEGGRRSPSSSNWQPWDFVVVTDRQQLGELSGVWRGGRHVAQSAATLPMIAPVPPDPQPPHFALSHAPI